MITPPHTHPQVAGHKFIETRTINLDVDGVFFKIFEKLYIYF